HPSLIVFDMAGIGFAASLFMGALVAFRRGIVRNGGQVRLAALQPNVEAAFRTARLGELFPILATVQAALEREPDGRSQETVHESAPRIGTIRCSRLRREGRFPPLIRVLGERGYKSRTVFHRGSTF